MSKDEATKPNPFQFAILMGMNRLGKPMYSGTVPEGTIELRRAKNKAAKRSRKINRKGNR